MARARKSAPDAPAGEAPSQSPESEAPSTPPKTVAKKGAATGGKRRPVPASRQEARDPDPIEPEPSLVVGIGASAGGYEAPPIRVGGHGGAGGDPEGQSKNRQPGREGHHD